MERIMQPMNRKSDSKNGQVKIEFTDKLITSWGGTAAIISRFLNKIKFKNVVEDCLPVKETSNNSTGEYSKVISLFISVLNGGFRFSHINYFDINSTVFRKCFNVSRFPKSSTGLTRYFNKYNKQSINEKLLSGIGLFFLPTLLKATGIAEDSLRFDSTVITRYGTQDGAKRGYNPQKKGRPSNQPQIAFLGSGYTVNFWNRSGNTSSSNGIIGFFHQTLSFIPWLKITRVLADSGYYNREFLEVLESQKMEYIISAPLYSNLQKLIYQHETWETVAPGIEVSDFDFMHSAESWKGNRRYVIVRQEIEKRPKASGKQLRLFEETEYGVSYRHSLLVTNNTKDSPYDIWNYYKPRANDEKIIDNLKDGFGLSAFNLDNFWATEAVLMTICLILHNLITYLIQHVIAEVGKNHKLRTIRMKYLIIPGQLGKNGRDYVLRLGISDPKRKSKFLQLIEKIELIFLNFNCNAVENSRQEIPA